MRQPNWDKHETALLIEAYWKIKADKSRKGAIVAALSSSLRKRASFDIDDTFRNENGINMRLGELDYLFSSGSVGLKNTSDLFREMVDMFLNNRSEYEMVLSEAKGMAARTLNVRAQFSEWLQEKAPKLRPEAVCQLLTIGEEFCNKIKVLTSPLFETTDAEVVKKYVKTVANNKIFRIRNKKEYPAIVNAANWYYSFIRVLPELLPPAQEAEQKQVSSLTSTHKNDAIRLGDNILDYFELIKTDYPGFVFTNHNAKGETINRAVFIFKEDSKRRDNVLFEIWHLSTEGQFDLYIKRSLMTEEEIQESLRSWDRTTDTRGKITRQWQSRHELTDFLVSKLDLAKKNIEVENSASDSSDFDEITASFDGTQDYCYTKPLWFRYKNRDKELVSTWSKLYTSLMKQLAEDYADAFVADLTLLSGDRIDIAKVSESYKLRRYSQLTGDLLIEINLSANGFMKRIAAAASMVGLTSEDIEIHYTKRISDRRGGRSNDSSIDNDKSTDRITMELIEEVDTLIRDSVDGITKNDICERFSNYSTYQINLALESCHAVLILKKYYHRDNISDYQEMADILLEVINKQFSQNGNYTSAQQLYNEARPRLDDFFFYNNAFDSRQEVYDLAAHLFDQEKYKGNSFIFMNNMHIWKEEPDYPKDYHGLLIKYAREHGNTFSREDALSYFDQIGSTTPAATFSNVIFNTGSKSFLQYAENQFVLTEAIQINDYFLASVSAQIENLLEGEDYIATGEIDDYFYTILPKLPCGIYWSALLLEDVLRIYETGFTTIEAGKDNDKKTLPAAIVRKKSHYRSFSDVVWNEVSKSFSLPKEFTASEFREFLLNKGFIRGSKKMWSVHKTVAGDIRFYWTDNNGRVTIN